MIDFEFKKNCYGCGLCKNICPKNAISMCENSEGFLNPKIDKNKCINCGLCERKCLYLNEISVSKIDINNETYALQIRDEESLKKSSSGGFFYEVAKNFIKSGGYVVGCVWDKNMLPKHILSNQLDDIKKMQGSKYVQSDLSNVFKEVQEVIKEHKVLFVGTPCQVKAIKTFINHENLTTISLICEGVPSRKVWRKYKELLEKEQKSKLIKVNFRNKENCGWKMPDSVYSFKNLKEIKKLSFNLDYYVSSFIDGLIMNEKCYNCHFKGNNNPGDIIIGDFWKVPDDLFGEKTKNGVSAIIIKTENGKQLLNFLQNVDIKKVNMDLIINGNPNLVNSIQKPKERNIFFKNIDSENIDDNFKKCNHKITSNKKKILKILFDFKLLKYIKK